MKRSIVSSAGGISLALLLAWGCGPQRHEDSDMTIDPTGRQTGGELDPEAGEGFESDPYFYKLNSVAGEVRRPGGRGILDATITVVKTDETFRVDETGTFVIVLDPKKYGTNTHELVVSAPGYRPQRHTVTIPDKNQVQLNVELQPVEKK